MTTVSSFFKQDADQALGVFYPTDYLVATLSSPKVAGEARELLEQNGVKPDEILVLDGSQFLAMEEKIHKDADLWSKLTSQISKIIGTEELHLDYDLKNARAGAAFLAVYCPSQEEGQRFFGI